jgi:hypothetical protein
MPNKRFTTFRAASEFARQLAASNRCSVEIVRQGNGFLVLDLPSTTASSTGTRQRNEQPNSSADDGSWEQHVAIHRKREEAEAARYAEEARRHEANRRRYEERKPHLLERERIYRSMDDVELYSAWIERERSALELDEIQLLRDLVRERKGIAPTRPSVDVCRSCGQVGDNCTCGRSWF